MAATRFLDHILSGVAASRPAASATPQGALYFATDTGVISRSDGTSAWTSLLTASGIQPTILDAKGDLIAASAADTAARLAVGSNGQVLTADSGEATGVKWASAGSAGAMTQLADTTLGGTATTIDLTSISGSYNHLQLYCQLRTDQATSDDFARIRFNNDSGANQYENNAYYCLNAAMVLNGVETDTSGRAGLVIGSSGVAGDASAITIEIPNYKGTTFRKQMISNFSCRGSSTRIIAGQSTCNWKDTSAITRITLIAGGGSNFIAGSRVTLYGIL